jgi:hypothetical protein
VDQVKRIFEALRSEDSRERKEGNVREAGKCKDKGTSKTMEDFEIVTSKTKQKIGVYEGLNGIDNLVLFSS